MKGNYFIISVQITSWISKQPLVIVFDQAKHDLFYVSLKWVQASAEPSLL